VAASYAPGQDPTTDYRTKAEQLRNAQFNPAPLEAHFRESLKGIGAVNPAAYTAAVDAAMTRIKNLAKALPKDTSISIMVKSGGPTPEQHAAFQQYEAVTADRNLVFKYLKSGMMPQAVVDAMHEQHPDFMVELRDYVLNNQDEVQSAPHETQMALSRLLGVPLIPEASPDYVKRMQEPYAEAKAKAAQAQAQAQGAQALSGLPALQPSPAAMLVGPR
jgi:hypothetical protein